MVHVFHYYGGQHLCHKDGQHSVAAAAGVVEQAHDRGVCSAAYWIIWASKGLICI